MTEGRKASRKQVGQGSLKVAMRPIVVNFDSGGKL